MNYACKRHCFLATVLRLVTDRLRDKVIIVTGAARGIGAAIADSAVREGASVVLSDVDPAGEAVAAKLRDEAGSAVFQALDVRDPAGWARLVSEVKSRYGRIDGLVNNAALQVKYAPLDMPDTEWDRCMDVNLRGVWHGCRAILPTMIEVGAGSIVNIASVHGHQIIPGAFPYSVSKHGVIGITRALGVEYARKGVRINAISPGYIDTDPEAWSSDPGGLAACEALVPARRLGRPNEVAMTAVFLLSDEAPYIVASTIKIDGGRLALFHE